MSECYLKGNCPCQTSACQGDPDEGCPVYRYFRDLIQKKDAPKIMTINEVHALKPGDSAWMEWRILHEDGTVNTGMELCVVTPDYAFHYECIWDDDIQKVTIDDFPDQQSRFWSAKPTREERESTPWPDWKKEEWNG